MKDYIITNTNTRNTLLRYLRTYRTTILRYKENSRTWKTVATWERYWKEMNALEDMIDSIIALREAYGFKTDERTIASYEIAQEMRYTVTVNYAP
jgi:hypothetical protein